MYRSALSTNSSWVLDHPQPTMTQPSESSDDLIKLSCRNPKRIQLHDFLMLTRRVLQELTDSILLCRPFRIPCHSWSPSSNKLLPKARLAPLQIRHSSSSTRWKARQGADHFAREAKVQGLKSRAAFKLLEVGI